MNRKLYWGLAALILFISAFGFLLYRQHVDIQQLKKEAAEAEKQLEEKNMPIVENNQRPARPGFKLVPHGDHFHEVPIDAPDTWQEGLHEPIVEGDVSAYEGKPIDEDFYRENFSREQIESMLKSDQRVIEQYRTTYIPQFEESRKQMLDLLQLASDANAPEYSKKPSKDLLAHIEAQLNQYKFEVRNMEKMIEAMSNVLNEEANDVEK